MMRYVVSQDIESGMWYCHKKGYSYIPVSGSFSEKKADAMEYAKMYNSLPHKVEQIEQKRKDAFIREMES